MSQHVAARSVPGSLNDDLRSRDRSPVPLTPLSAVRREFLADLRNLKRAPQTVKWYAQRLDQLERDSHVSHLEHLTRSALRQYFSHMSLRDKQRSGAGQMSVESHRNHWRAISGFLHWARKEGYPLDPSIWDAEGQLAVRQPARDDSVQIEIFTSAEVAELRDLSLSERDRLIVEILLGMGLRRRELLWLPAEYEMHGNTVHVLGKRNKWRWVPIRTDLQKRLTDFRRRRGIKPFDELIYSERTQRPLTESGLKRLMDRVSEQAGFHCNPHKFRHTFATFFLRKNPGEIEQLRQILGHVDYATLRAYVHLSQSDLGKDWDNRAPF